MTDQKWFDARGRMGLLSRLLAFDREAFIHLVFYRALIFGSIITFVLFIASIPFHVLDLAWRIMIAIDWIFFTTQVFESIKALSLAGSEGAAFGHLNPSFVSSMLSVRHRGAYTAIPYVFLAIWIAGLIAYVGLVLI
ncbi:MAG: hypothetical protein QXP70_06495 [Methanomassiliicoccales archaeon]